MRRSHGVGQVGVVVVAGLCGSLLACSTDTFTGDSGTDAGPDAAEAGPATEGGVEDVRAPDVVVEAGCPATVFTATPSVADGMMSAGQPNILGWDALGSMGARNDLGSPMEAFVRFDVTGLPSTVAIQSVTVDLAWAASSKDCGSNNQCGSCASIDKAGDLDIYAMRSDWTESANWNTRDGSNPWGVPGASQIGTDRSNLAGMFHHDLGSSSSASVQPSLFTQWRSGNQVSFLLQAEATGNTSNDAVFLIATREGKSICPQSGDAPKLTVTYCP